MPWGNRSKSSLKVSEETEEGKGKKKEGDKEEEPGTGPRVPSHCRAMRSGRSSPAWMNGQPDRQVSTPWVPPLVQEPQDSLFGVESILFFHFHDNHLGWLIAVLVFGSAWKTEGDSESGGGVGGRTH